MKSDKAQGYTKAANKGLKVSTADYAILLNSDTIVTNGWLEKIIECGESNDKIGIIGPLSNAASYQSVPKRRDNKGDWATNPIPEELNIDDIAKIVEKVSKKQFPLVPVINGFCFAIKKEVINTIGYLDEENFPYGYGEENDYCIRALDAGYFCAVADQAYVYHAKSKSFGHQKRAQLSKEGWENLKVKHGSNRLAEIIKQLENEPVLKSIGHNVEKSIKKIIDRKHSHNDLIKNCTTKTTYSNYKAQIDKFNKKYQKYIKECEKSESFNEKLPNSCHIIILLFKERDTSDLKESLNSIINTGYEIPVTVILPKNKKIDSSSFIDINFENFEEYDENEHTFIKVINELLTSIKEDYILIIQAGDLIARGAINNYGLILKENIEIGDLPAAIVFDDDIIDEKKIRKYPRLKPGFSPDYLLEYDYIGYSVWLHKNSILQVGAFNEQYKNEYIRDVILRLWKQGYKIVKSDHISCHRCPKIISSYSNKENITFLKNSIQRLHDENYKISYLAYGPRPTYDTKDTLVSIIIPFRDQFTITKRCVESIFKLTDYNNFEILLINNNSCQNETYNYLNEIKSNPKIRVINYNKQFNYSKINNFATKYARGDVLVFLNNDTEVISTNWLRELVGDALQPGVGAVGAKLYYPDGTIQHTGVVIGLNGLAGHLFAGEDETFVPQEWVRYRRNVSAVTGACLAVARKTFINVGGFNEEFIVTGSDVELCLRLMEKGFRNIINPEVKLFHYEKKTRKNIRVKDIDIRLSLIYYQPYLELGDPFYNGNLSYNSNTINLNIKNQDTARNQLVEKYKKKLNRKYDKNMENIKKINENIKDSSSDLLKRFDQEVLKYDVSPVEIEENKELMARFYRGVKLELNKTLWFVPFFDHVYRGGIYTIFRVAQYFSQRENTKNIFVLYGKKVKEISDIKTQIEFAFPNLNFEIIHLKKNEDINRLPNSDAAFCTLWNSAYYLVRYNKCKAKYYFNQDFEPAFYPAGSVYGLIEQTYRFGFIGITNTPGVANKYCQYNRWVDYFVPGVDKNIFYSSHKNINKHGPWRIVFYGRPNNPRNGFRLGIEALRRIKVLYGNKVQIISAGGDFDLKDYGLEGIINNVGVLPTIEDVAALYRSCDIGLVFMFTPHPSYQPFEFMASGCATITNYNESNLWLLRDGENSLLTEPTVSCVVWRIMELLENPELRQKIVKGGLETVKRLSWDSALNKIYTFVREPRPYLEAANNEQY